MSVRGRLLQKKSGGIWLQIPGGGSHNADYRALLLQNWAPEL